MATILLGITLLSILLCGSSLSKNVMSGAPELGNGVLFNWKIVDESYLEMKVKLPVSFKWVVIGFHQVPFAYTEWEDLAFVSIRRESGGSLVSVLKTVRLDEDGDMKEVKTGLYDWQRNGRRKSKGFFYLRLTREIGTLSLDLPIKCVWAYGKHGSFKKLRDSMINRFKYGMVTLRQPDVLRTAPLQHLNVTRMQPSHETNGVSNEVEQTQETDSAGENNAGAAETTTEVNNPGDQDATQTNNVSNEPDDQGVSKSSTEEENNTGDQDAVNHNTEFPILTEIIPNNSNQGKVSETDTVTEQSLTTQKSDNKQTGVSEGSKANVITQTKTENNIESGSIRTKILKMKTKTFPAQPSEPTKKLIRLTSEVGLTTTAKTSVDNGSLSSPTQKCNSTKKCNCGKERHWYDMMTGNESQIYFAVIGIAALSTGLIVLCLACCCNKKQRKLRRIKKKNKVSFYKVDDFESTDAEEEIEFLRDESDMKDMKHA